MAPMKHLALFFISLVALSGSAWGQSSTTEHRMKQLREAYQEKLKVDLPTARARAIEQKRAANTPMSVSSGTLSINEKAVSSLAVAEAEIHAAINPTDTNNIVVSPMQLQSTLTIPIYYSKDFGKNWKKSIFKPAPYESTAFVIGGGDPLFAYDADGKLYMSWIDLYTNSAFDSICAGTYWAYSVDGGQNWIRPKDAYVGVSKGPLDVSTGPDSNFALDDKEWLTVDRSSSSHRGTLYVAWTHIARNSYGVYVRRKLPNVDSMEPPVLVSKGSYQDVQYTSIGIDRQGYVHVTFMGTHDGTNLALYHSLSTDGGATFQPERKVSDVDVPGASGDAIEDTIFGLRHPGNYPCPHLGIDTAVTGNMYLVWNALGTTSNDGHGADIYLSEWDPQTTQWSTPIVLNHDTHTHPTDHFYPSISVNDQGVVTVTWYDRREDSANVEARLYLAQSFDYGLTWSNYPVASQVTDFSTVGEQNGGFGIGEYNQVMTTRGYAIPIWCDGRKGNGDLDVYAAFIPISKDGLSVGSRLERVASAIENVQVYPTPAASHVTARFTLRDGSIGSVTVINPLGQVVQTLSPAGSLAAGVHTYDISAQDLASGTYYLAIRTDRGVEEAPFVVTH
jgi:hypothetical protein